MKQENKVRAIMGWSFTIVTIISLLLVMGSVLAQIQIDPVNSDCPDYCDQKTDTLYQKGLFDSKLRQCVYNLQTPCKYGCKDDKICAEFPETPPTNTSEYDDTLWKMSKKVYDTTRIQISTGATEYTFDDNATVFAKVTDLGFPVNDGFCDVQVFAPNLTQIAGFQLDYVNNSRGIYSHLYPVPDEYGVYIVDVECFMPFNATNQTRYFRTVSSVDKFLNITTTVGQSATLTDLSLVTQCFGKRWTESYLDKQNGNISDYRFLQNITNIIGWFADDTSASTDYEITLNFYKITDKGTVEIGSTKETVSIASADVPVYFNDTGTEMPFDSSSMLQVEICARRISGGNPTNLIFWYNNNSYNSSFLIHTLDYDDPLDFVVGGSSEIHVSSIPLETYLTFATLPEPVLQSNHDICTDNQTHVKILTWEQCVGNVCKNVSQNQTEYCPFGCYGNLTYGNCNPAPFDRTLFLIFLVIGIMALVIGSAVVYERFSRGARR